MPLEIQEGYEGFVKLDETGEFVEQYVCPVDGCNKFDKRSPGGVIAHIILVADPDVLGHHEYDKGSHAAYLKKQGGPDVIKEFPKYLATLPVLPVEAGGD